MSGKVIKTEIQDSDWMSYLDCLTVEEAIAWLGNYPRDAVLETGWDYGGKSGEIYSVRVETESEEAIRLAQEEAERVAREAHAEAAERLRLERFEERQQRLKLENVALQAYLKKHKGNQNIGDLENLFLTVMNLERAGHGPATTGPLKEMMERLEKQ